MGRSGPGALGVFLAVLLAGAALGVLLPRFLKVAAGPDSEVIAQLKDTERTGLSLPVPGVQTPLEAQSHRYDRFTALLEPDGQTLHLGCTLELTGKLGAIRIGSFTAERLRWTYQTGSWTPDGGQAPLLTGVVAALERRRRALERLDQAALAGLLEPGASPAPEDLRELAAFGALRNRRYEVQAWYIRVEGDDAVVTEDHRLSGDLPDRPVDRSGPRRLNLKRIGREFFFSARLM